MRADEMLLILRRWTVKRNTDRVNVAPEGDDAVLSEMFGLAESRNGEVSVCQTALKYPNFVRAINLFFSTNVPYKFKANLMEVNTSPCTAAVCVNQGFSARRHRDSRNLGPSWVVAFGEFTGGLLRTWPSDPGAKKQDYGKLDDQTSVLIDVKNDLQAFDGNKAHEVTAYSCEGEAGERYSIVYYMPKCSQNRNKLTTLHI